MIKAIIFDFDGVILESASIKTNAFAEVVKDFPKDVAAEFVSYHMSHMGISRYVKFRYLVEKILHEQYTEEKGNELADRFSSIVFNRVMECSFVPGAKEFLEGYSSNYDMYIASGTPDAEMQEIIDKRELREYFCGVYGTPLKKRDIIQKIMSDHEYNKDEVVFVGDANTDMDAAYAEGLYFVGRNTKDNENYFKSVRFKVDNLLEICDVIRIIEQETVNR